MLQSNPIREYIALRRAHKVIADAEARLTNWLGVPICIPNCGKCCSDNLITIYSIEATLILSFLIGDGKMKVIEWCKEWLIEKHTAAPTYNGIPYGFISPELKHEWTALSRTGCPLLLPDKRCFIHNPRPLVCRSYGVTVTAGAACPRPLSKYESRGSMAYIGGAEADAIEDAFNKLFGKMRAEHPDYMRMGFLPTMIFRNAREKEFRELIAENKIASAKLVGTDVTTQVLFEKQLQACENILHI